jgi:hypothetical protein
MEGVIARQIALIIATLCLTSVAAMGLEPMTATIKGLRM